MNDKDKEILIIKITTLRDSLADVQLQAMCSIMIAMVDSIRPDTEIGFIQETKK